MKVTKIEGETCSVELTGVDVVALCMLVALGSVACHASQRQEVTDARGDLIERGTGYIKTLRDAYGAAAGVEQEQDEPQEVSSDD